MQRIIVFISLLFSLASLSQKRDNDTIPTRNFSLLKANYKDIAFSNDKLFGVTTYNNLVIWDLINNNPVQIIKGISAISKNSGNNIICATITGVVKILEPDNKWKTLDSISSSIYKIVIDKDDEYAILSDKGIYYKKQWFVPDSKSPMHRKAGRMKRNDYIILPDVIFLDKEQRIWMAYDAGEWGGDGCFFDLIKKEFYCDESLSGMYYNKYDKWEDSDTVLLNEFPDLIKITDSDTLYKFPHNLYLSNIKGIAQDNNGDFYTSESLMHFGVSGNINKLIQTEFQNFYEHCEVKGALDQIAHTVEFADKKYTSYEVTEYLGPITWNKFDNNIYYYTNNGFFRLVDKDGSYTKKLIVTPKITWTSGMADAVGYQMNVTKFEFVDEIRFLFITSNNGIGFYTGKEIFFYK